MKKYTIMALILVLSIVALTGCRRRNDTVTVPTVTTEATTQMTTAPTTMPTTEATTAPSTYATEGTVPTEELLPTDTGATDGTGSTEEAPASRSRRTPSAK